METQRRKTGLSLLGFFRVFPIANKFFIASMIAFASFNAALFALTDTTALSQWIATTEPVTNWISHTFPGIDLATDHLQENRGAHLIPAIRNALAFNFILLLTFPIPTILAAFVDIKRGGTVIFHNIDRVVANTARSFSFFLVVLPLVSATFCLSIYLGYGVTPLVVDVRLDYVSYALVFSCGYLTVCMSVVLFQVKWLRRWIGVATIPAAKQ